MITVVEATQSKAHHQKFSCCVNPRLLIYQTKITPKTFPDKDKNQEKHVIEEKLQMDASNCMKT